MDGTHAAVFVVDIVVLALITMSQLNAIRLIGARTSDAQMTQSQSHLPVVLSASLSAQEMRQTPAFWRLGSSIKLGVRPICMYYIRIVENIHR